MILYVITDIDIHYLTPTHMKQRSCRPDVVDIYYGGPAWNHLIHFILPIIPSNNTRTSIMPKQHYWTQHI